MSDLLDLQDKAMEVRVKYEKYEIAKYGQSWTPEQLANGFKKDVEDLIAILSTDNIDNEKLRHEIADCLWSVLVIAKKTQVDLEPAFLDTMKELHERLDRELI